jgi:cAMP phosphodiesterase
VKVELLSGGGANDLQEQYLTSFIINHNLTVDAGALPLALTRDRQLKICDIIITHSHLDHFAGLPLMLDNIFMEMNHIVKVHAIAETVQALREHIFNNSIWPDFSSFKNKHGANLQFQTIIPYQPFTIDNLRIQAIPVTHTVPTIGLIMESAKASVVISSDTGDTDELWAIARQISNLKGAFIECSYPNHLCHLATSYGHLCPNQMLKQVHKLGRPIPIYAYHIKPAHMTEVLAELRELRGSGIEPALPGHAYQF